MIHSRQMSDISVGFSTPPLPSEGILHSRQMSDISVGFSIHPLQQRLMETDTLLASPTLVEIDCVDVGNEGMMIFVRCTRSTALVFGSSMELLLERLQHIPLLLEKGFQSISLLPARPLLVGGLLEAMVPDLET